MATANVNTPRGLNPVRLHSSATNAGAVTEYLVPAASANVLMIGDPVVKVDGTGNARAMGVDLATAGGAITGSIVGFTGSTPAGSSNEPSLLGLSYSGLSARRLAGTGMDFYVLVNDDAETLYEITCNGVLPETAVGKTANFVYEAGNTVSGVVLDVGTVAATGGQLVIERFSSHPNNYALDTTPVVLVKIVKHTEGDDQAGV